MPEIRKQMQEIYKEFSNINMKDIAVNLDVKGMKKQIKQASKVIKNAFNPDDTSGIIYSGNFAKDIKGISTQFNKLKGTKIDLNNALGLSKYKEEIEEIKKISSENWQEIPINKGFKYDTKSIQEFLDDYKNAGKVIDKTKEKQVKLKQEINQAGSSQNKLTAFFSLFKGKLDQAKNTVSNLKGNFNQIPKITQKVTNNIKNMGTGLKSGLKHVLKYAMALFSLRGIYSVLSNSARAWLSSQNAGAQQLSANIEYMKYAMGSVFAPVIEYVINLVYQLMKAIQNLVYAFSGANIFAKATASSMNSTANSASKASKSLSGVHGEINNVSENDSSGRGATSPSMDLSTVDSQMSSFTQKLYDFFAPLKQSWDIYGNGLIKQVKETVRQITGLVSSVWGSFENVITDGTVYSTLENILSIIGSIAEAFANAWNNDGTGDAIIQNIATAFNNILETIDKIVQSTVFQWILNTGVKAIEKLTEVVEIVTGKINEFVGFLTGSNETLDGWALLIGSIVTAVLLLVAAIGAYNVITAIMGVVTAIATSPITLIVLAIAALIAIIVLCVKHWDTIKETVINVCNKIKEVAVSVWNKVKETISNVIEKIKTTISNILNSIKTTWNNIWNGIKTTVVNIWNGIWGAIKNIINSILGGIESFVNGVIKGINKVLSGISKVANAVGSLIGLNPINLQLSTISLPRLAKGNVAYSETVAVFGEYTGASNNPEITTPQNIMAETFRDVLSDYEYSNNKSTGEIKQIVFQFGSYRVGVEMEKLLQQARRQNGTATVTV